MDAVCDLSQRRCLPCEGGVERLTPAKAAQLLEALPGWELAEDKISRSFRFANHYETMAFANAVAWISHRENHHPEMTIGYSNCRVGYWTHAIGGLSENDFICAAKVDQLTAAA